MSDNLGGVLASLEGLEFSHAGQSYAVVTATANRDALDDVPKGADAPVKFHFTVTSPSRKEPIGVQLRLDAQRATDLAYVRDALEGAVAAIVEGRLPPGTRELH